MVKTQKSKILLLTKREEDRKGAEAVMAMDPSIAAQAAEAFFRAAPPLRDHDHVAASVADFVARHSTGSGVICITSGGTTVPLEQRCVRYIDNFASGQRGAAATEYFLKAGYAVIFIHQRGSKQPYCRFLPEDSFLDLFELGEDSEIQVPQSHSAVVKAAISNYRKAVDEGLLLKLPFLTIFEYLQLLQMVSTSMSCLGQRGMFFLAAAVSDFYVPWESMLHYNILKHFFFINLDDGWPTESNNSSTIVDQLSQSTVNELSQCHKF